MRCVPNYSRAVITIEGLAKLRLEIKNLEGRVAKLMQDSGDWSARSNTSFAGGCQIPSCIDEEMQSLQNQINQKMALSLQATLAPDATSRERAAINTVIVLMYNTRQGKAHTYKRYCPHHIVGFEEGDCDSFPRRISYESGLARMFIGKRKGFKTMCRLDGKMRTVTLTAIHLPSDPAVKSYIQRALKVSAP